MTQDEIKVWAKHYPWSLGLDRVIIFLYGKTGLEEVKKQRLENRIEGYKTTIWWHNASKRYMEGKRIR